MNEGPTTRAKFKVVQKIENEGGYHTVKLMPVYSGSEENLKFYKATPGGDITLSDVGAEVLALFETSQEFYIDFTPA